jgi:hypothetical protein
MHTEKREDPLVEMGYEVRDINIKAIKVATYIFFAFAVGSGAIGYVIYELMNPRVMGGQPQPTFAKRIPQSPNPLLQTNMTAKTDIMSLRAKEDKFLTGAPGQLPDGGYHIPIDAAMQMVAEQGGRTPGVQDSTVQQTQKPVGAMAGNVAIPLNKPASPGSGGGQ